MRRIGSSVLSWLVAVAVTAMLSSVSMSFAAVLNDEVTSIKLKEADGTSGQNTNSGSGVKTGHIQDGAVTSTKIADGSVTTTKIGLGAVSNGNIADGAITDAKITGPISGTKLGAHGHSGADITDGTIISSKLADGAVTDVKISGPISAQKLAGIVGMEKVGTYTGILVVHQGAQDGVHTFNTVIDAMNVANSLPGRTAILVMPGYYQENFSAYLHNTDVRNVDIIGASRVGTVIKAIGAVDSWRGYQYMPVPSGLTLQHLTFEGYLQFVDNHDVTINDCTIKAGIALSMYNNLLNIRVENVSIESTEIGLLLFINTDTDTITFKNMEIKIQNGGTGIHSRESYGRPTKMTDITIIGAGLGIDHYVGALDLENVRFRNVQTGFSSGEGLWTIFTARNCNFDAVTNIVGVNGVVSVDGSTIRGLVASGGTTKIGSSKLVGTIAGNNTVKLVNCYDDSYSALLNGLY